jgi:hypothetical protein
MYFKIKDEQLKRTSMKKLSVSREPFKELSIAENLTLRYRNITKNLFYYLRCAG